MKALWDKVLLVIRTSEFWVFLAQIIVMNISTPVPDEFKTIGWLYIIFRVIGKVVQFIFPNPTSTESGWLKDDSPK